MRADATRSNRIVYEGPMHPELEDSLVERVRRLKGLDPLGPVTVVVGSGLVSTYLAGLCAGRGAPTFNVRFVTLPEIARALVSRAEGAFLPGLSPQGQELAVSHAIRRTLAGGYFAAVSARPGFVGAVNGTISDIEQAGFLPDEVERRLELGLGRAGGGRGVGIPARLVEFLNCYRDYRAIVSGRVRTRFDLFDEACRQARRFGEVFGHHLTVYGFYELTGLQKRLLSALTQAVETVAAMVPLDAPAAVAGEAGYSERLIEWWTGLGCRRVRLTRRDQDQGQPGSGAEAGPGGFPAQDGEVGSGRYVRPRRGVEVSIVSAPGEAREAREIARTIRALARDRGVRLSDIGVLLRDRTVYARLLHEALEAAGIPHFVSEGVPLGQTRAGRALVLLCSIVRSAVVAGKPLDRSRAEELLSFLPPDPSVPSDNGAAARLVERLRSLPGQGTWAEMTGEFLRVASDLGFAALGGPEGWPWCRAALESVGEHDHLGLGPTTLEDLVSAIAAAVAAGRMPQGRFGSGVNVCDLMSARGLSFEVVFVPGLVEKVFPAQSHQDPILPDAEREAIGSLPLARDRAAEEMMLFSLAVGAARKLLVLSFPRIDPQSARERVPSYYLLLIARGITGLPVDYRALPAVRGFRRVPLSTLDVGDPADAIDPIELDAALLRTVAPPGGVSPRDLADELAAGTFDSRPWTFLESGCPWFRRACQAEGNRWGMAWLTAYDGVIAGADLRRKVAQRARAGQRHGRADTTDGAGAAGPWAVTVLEEYARCPYRFFLSRALGLSVASEPGALDGLVGADRGVVVHRVAARLFQDALARSEQGETDMVPPGPGNLDRWIGMLRGAVQDVFDDESQGLRGSLLGTMERKALAADMAAWLGEEARRWPPGLLPVMAEAEFGHPPAPALAVKLGTGDEAGLSGRIDRVDATPDRTRFRVVDYKSGVLRQARNGDLLRGGTRLQVPAYMLAASTILGLGRVEDSQGVYVHVPRGAGRQNNYTAAPVAVPGEAWAGLSQALAEALACILEGIAAGLFFAYPGPDAENCSWCEFDDACEAGRDLLFGMKVKGRTEQTRRADLIGRFLAMKGLDAEPERE